jgi:hypothetical protein
MPGSQQGVPRADHPFGAALAGVPADRPCTQNGGDACVADVEAGSLTVTGSQGDAAPDPCRLCVHDVCMNYGLDGTQNIRSCALDSPAAGH